MIKAPVSLQDLRRKIYIKAKAEPSWRFWGLYVHICKEETLRAAYQMAKKNKGAPGIDGVTFEDIDGAGVEDFLAQIQGELINKTYRPTRYRHKAIPKEGTGKVRVLSIATIRDRVVQGAVRLILEPIFEADFQPGSYGYRPRRTAHQAVLRVQNAIVFNKTRVIDVDLRAFFDNVRQDILFKKVAIRVNDEDVMALLKKILRAAGNKGVPQGSPLSPLLSNVYLNQVDKMLERAKETTRNGSYTFVEYARYADDLVILVDAFPRHQWLHRAVNRRLREELATLRVEVNEEKSRNAELARGESFRFLGFEFRRIKSLAGKWRGQYTPKPEARTRLLRRLKDIFLGYRSQPVERVVYLINPILRGWVNYFRVGHSSRCFRYVRDWVEKKIRRHMMKARKRQGFGWKRWSREWLHKNLGLFEDYQIRYIGPQLKARPAQQAT